jgi:hypothetical protein
MWYLYNSNGNERLNLHPKLFNVRWKIEMSVRVLAEQLKIRDETDVQESSSKYCGM